MNTYAASVNQLWTTALRAVGIGGHSCAEPTCQPRCGHGPAPDTHLTEWVDRVRLSGPR